MIISYVQVYQMNKDAIIRALAAENDTLSKKVGHWTVECITWNDTCYFTARISIGPTIRHNFDLFKFYSGSRIITDDDECIFVDTNDCKHRTTEYIGVVFHYGSAKIIKADNGSYCYTGIFPYIAKELSRSVVRIARERGIPVSTVAQVQIPSYKTYKKIKKRRLNHG